MRTYVDTGVLLKIYIKEPELKLADKLILDAGSPLPFTHLHEIELRTAFRLKP